MKEMVLLAKQRNWGMIGPNSWIEREWKIYNDLSVDIKLTYNSITEENRFQFYDCFISLENYEKITKNLKLAKENDVEVNAYDGEAWEFTYYDKGIELWKREKGYIYNIEPLEEIARILYNLIK